MYEKRRLAIRIYLRFVVILSGEFYLRPSLNESSENVRLFLYTAVKAELT